MKKKKDEDYVLDICDQVLGITSSRQHRFDFLLGDVSNKTGRAVKIPVDGYYEELRLVIEYHERQHTEGVPFFDKPNKITVSGIPRRKQREKYDALRRVVLPQHKIKIIEFSYLDFKYNGQKRIIKDLFYDLNIVQNKLNDFIRNHNNLK